jgi:CheY-like chemotaxis protein
MSQRRLLVVDDEPDFIRVVSEVAADLGYAVHACAQSKDFRKVYAEFGPTHILLDMVMPDVEGFEIIRWLVKEGTRAKVIVATGYNPKYMDMAQLFGADGGIPSVTTLIKPVSVVDLRASLV